MKQERTWVLPLDPSCPAVAHFMGRADDRTKIPWSLFDRLLEDFERFHRERCKQCRRYAVANGSFDGPED